VAVCAISFYNRDMKSNYLGRFVLWSALAVSLIFGATATLAQTPTTGVFAVRPSKVEVMLPPGESALRVVALENGTPSPLVVRVSYEDVSAGVQERPHDDPFVLGEESNSPTTLRDMLTLPDREITVLSGERVEVPVTVRVPARAIPGGYDGSLVFAFRTPSGAQGSAQVAVESRLATLFFVRVLGDVTESGRVVAFGLFNNRRAVSTPSSDEPLRFQVAYENSGSVHVNPYGQVKLTPLFGSPRYLEVDPWIVLPGATRMRELMYAQPLFPGYYRATLEHNAGYGDVVEERTVSFVVLPSFIGGFLTFAALVGIVLLVRRSLRLSRHSLSS
jgi:hypothetical protein